MKAAGMASEQSRLMWPAGTEFIEQCMRAPLREMRSPILILKMRECDTYCRADYAEAPASRTTPASPLSRAMYWS